jgi:hypothetical protein
MTGKRLRCCAGLLTIIRNFTATVKLGETLAVEAHRSEQFRSAIFLRLSDHHGRDEHFFSLYSGLLN